MRNVKIMSKLFVFVLLVSFAGLAFGEKTGTLSTNDNKGMTADEV